ncbi:hypothetical protein [Nocardia bovistercoris]|uniref:Uncharacterized protein n=1 Tax=Nocardia bovistercoris TaxID=2785916 RepID=A0A931N2Q0_9NOCA|nr:hypothetical protein [Nocardia bovistercoris]MBH0776286.1 hypothetical protein [Nocardia bovistercoris]
MPDRAIGVLHLGISVEILRDHSTIERLARKHGHELVRIVTLDDSTYMPTVFVVGAAAESRAGVIITPDLAHLGAGYKAVTLACGLLLPTGPIARR